MKNSKMTRRSFLLLAAGAAVVTVFPGCTRKIGLSEEERRVLLRVARLLYPHDTLSDDVYKKVLGPLREKAIANSTFAADLRAGLTELDHLAGGDWQTASENVQIEALKQVEGESFFQAVQGNVRVKLYRHPEVWKLIGYEGSALEKGGYLQRGFNDINWLPED